jgi:hypothetical protein
MQLLQGTEDEEICSFVGAQKGQEYEASTWDEDEEICTLVRARRSRNMQLL